MQNFSISRKFVIVGQQLTIWTVNLLPNAIAAEGAQNRRSDRSSASVQALRINSKTIPHKLYYLDLCTSRYLPSYWTTEEDFTRNLVETSSPAQALAKLFQNHTIRRRHLKIAAIILCIMFYSKFHQNRHTYAETLLSDRSKSFISQSQSIGLWVKST